MEDIEKLKEQIKAEILAELTAKKSKQPRAAKNAIDKWIKDPNGALTISVGMGTAWKMYESTRNIVRLLYNKSSCAGLCNVNQEELEVTFDALFGVILECKRKIAEKE